MTETYVVTGGIGTGKSTVAGMFGDLGATVLDADRIGHGVLEPGGAAEAEVRSTWPSVVVGGTVDRSRLGAIVFGDESQLRQLEAITHPHIVAELRRQIDMSESPVTMVEISVGHRLLDVPPTRTIVCDLDTAERRARLRARGMNDEDIDRRMAAQPRRSEWLAMGTIVISTAGTFDDVRARVERVWRSIVA